ncbi:MAG: glycosyltransferase family 39 protein [Chloroflexi bacterium]|nr:glycosyltransferase family 39 protein [Chloroflexota bacterium]
MLLINARDLLPALAGMVFAYPWAALALGRGRAPLLTALVTLALSLGALTLGMMGLALIGGLRPGVLWLGMLVIFGAGLALLHRRELLPRWRGRAALRGAGARMRAHPLQVVALAVIVAILALVTFNLLYWPFNADDAVSIYAMQSRAIFETRALPDDDGLYEAYPMLMPLSYAYVHLVSGTINEYLALGFAAALSIGTFGAAGALGVSLYDRRTGLIAALLLALTPIFVRWSATGYTDVPAGMFVALSALFAWRLLQDGSGRDALLAGVMAGLAAWTKNSALAVALSLAAIVAYGMLPRMEGARLTLRHAALAGLGGLVTAGPWYIRNLLLIGRPVPATLWADQAEPTLENLIPFMMHLGTEQFFVPGVVLTMGMALMLVEALRLVGPQRDSARVLLVFALPFAAAWWRLASYEVRFLMTILPLVAVMGARAVVRVGEWLPRANSASSRRAVTVIGAALLIAMALPAARKAVLFKGEIARDPLMDDATRHRVTLGAVYDVARYLDALPADGMILSDTYYLPFHVHSAPVVVGGLPHRDALARYRFLVLSPGSPLPGALAAGDALLLANIDGFRVYRVTYDPTP